MKSQRTCTLPQRTFDDRGRNHRGFALVIALSLMALILLLVLSITTLIQVETRSTQIHLHALQARESAQLALTMAIAQLQDHASHDQRITARAEILGDEAIHSAARFWTGVWDATDMNQEPVWLVSGEDVDADTTPSEPMQLVGAGTVGNNPSQYVRVPTVEIFNAKGKISNRLGWWISDEGVKASVARLPLHERPTPNFLEEDDDALKLQLASTHGLEAIFDQYDRFDSSSTRLLDRVSSIGQLDAFEKFSESDPDTSREALFHTLTLNSYGVLASTTDSGLMQDLSLFPAILEAGLQNYLQLGEAHANQLAAQTNPLTKKLLFTDIIGLDEIGPLEGGDIATPIIPVLSNFMIAFTIRTKNDKPEDNDENFLLRARFFCEFWNPFTHTLSMVDDEGNTIHLELEITGFPEVTVHSNSESSKPIDLQKVMADPSSSDNAVIIRLLNGASEPWFPGRSKNWVGLENNDLDLIHSPYESILVNSKQWDRNDNTLGGIDGIDTGVKGFSGNIRHKSSGQNILHIKVYRVTESSRKLISNLDGLLYEPVSTINPTNGEHYSNTYKDMTFGYHIMLREPNNSYDDSEYFRGRWLKDHDPRSPIPIFRGDWHLDNNIEDYTGSPYAAVFNGIEELILPEPHKIYQNKEGDTIDSDRLERLLDRSKGDNNSLNKLWQDAPLFELPRRRILSLASLQHIYIHNERPFQVGNSWGNQGKHNTSAWFDRYHFSGLSRSDDPDNFESRAGPGNPCLQFINTDSFLTRFPMWKEDPTNDSDAARKPAQHLMVANRFNINSTSVDAWKAVLSSLRIDDFNHLYWPGKDTSDLDTLSLIPISRKEGSFTRFSHSLEETYQATVSPARLDAAPSAFYRHGARRFDSEMFDIFAEEIVQLIQQKGRPFESMEAFLSKLPPDKGSLLEQAIRNVLTHPITKRQQWYHNWETTGQRIESETPIEIDHFAPGFLTQADIMTAIGPMLAPRSDTFKIRARGECFDNFGERIGSATLEAVLQRIPEATDITIELDTPTKRKWKLISTRWLKDNEL